MLRVVTLGVLLYVIIFLTMAVWGLLTDHYWAWRARRAKRLLDGMPKLVETPSSSDEWWEKGEPPPEWQAPDESRETE